MKLRRTFGQLAAVLQRDSEDKQLFSGRSFWMDGRRLQAPLTPPWRAPFTYFCLSLRLIRVRNPTSITFYHRFLILQHSQQPLASAVHPHIAFFAVRPHSFRIFWERTTLVHPNGATGNPGLPAPAPPHSKLTPPTPRIKFFVVSDRPGWPQAILRTGGLGQSTLRTCSMF